MLKNRRKGLAWVDGDGVEWSYRRSLTNRVRRIQMMTIVVSVWTPLFDHSCAYTRHGGHFLIDWKVKFKTFNSNPPNIRSETHLEVLTWLDSIIGQKDKLESSLSCSLVQNILFLLFFCYKIQ